MSEITILQPPSNAPSYRRNSTMNRMLLWKEFRQLGRYAVAITLPALAFILLMPLMPMLGCDWSHPKYFFQVARVIPLLVILATASSTFSIEHENQSFQFLRSLPLSSGQIAATKILVAGVYGLLAALIFWPIANCIRQSSPPPSLFYELLPVSMAAGSVFLWAIYASLSCRTVLNAITKSMIGFMFFFFAPENISLFDLNVHHDFFYWLFETVIKLASALFLIVMIAVKSQTWCKDHETWQPWSFALTDRVLEIKTCASITWTSPFWRLVWLQRRTGLPIFATTVPICVVLMWVLFEYGTPIEITLPLILFVCAGVLGSVVFNGIQSAKTMLIQQNYRPSLIWFSQIAAPLCCCLIVGLAADSQDKESPRFLHFTVWSVMGFSIGQLFSMICRTYVVTIAFTLLTLGTLLLVNILPFSGAHNQYWLSWTLMICLLLVATFSHRRIWLYERPMSRTLNTTLACLAMLALLQIPLYRTYDVPWVSKGELRAKLPIDTDVNQKDLINLRTLARKLPWLDDVNPATEIECDLGEKILAYEGGELLVTHANPSHQDFDLYASTTRFLMGLMIKPCHGSSDRSHALKIKIFESWPGSLRFGFVPFDAAISLAQDQRTSASDIQRLILALEEEGRFDSYRYLMQSVHHSRTENAEEFNVTYDDNYRANFETILFWEQIRKRRVLNYFLMTAIDAIDELDKSHHNSETQSDWLKRKQAFLSKRYKSLIGEYPEIDFLNGLEHNFFLFLTQQRAIRIGLAIVAWQKENHGKHPESLDQLVGKYLKRVPNSPINGTPFYYSPTGLQNEKIHPEGPTRNLHNLGEGTDGLSGVANQPFLWLNGWLSWDSSSVNNLSAITSVNELTSKDRENDKNLMYIQFYLVPKMNNLQQTAR